MQPDSSCQNYSESPGGGARSLRRQCADSEIEVGLLTGGQDWHYAFGLATALISNGVCLDFIGGDEVESAELHGTPRVNFLNLRGSRQPNAHLVKKISRVLTHYLRLIRYAAGAKPQVFHILWNNRFEFFDRTLLMLYYKLLRKKIALTAHNVNAGTRDSTDTPLNRLTLRIQYHLADHIFVHTEKMKSELIEEFGVRKAAVTVIPYGINNAVPDTGLRSDQAKQRLGISDGERTILFFGNIAPYKGLDYLISAFQRIVTAGGNYRLIIAGRPKKGCEGHWDEIHQTINRCVYPERIILKIGYIPEGDIELYFKAADVLALPYRHIFQSGVLFLGYSFGLPVIAADVGSLKDDIIEGKTGFVSRPEDSVDLARTIERYFSSDLFKGLENRRQEIRDYAIKLHSWDAVGRITRNVYAELVRN